MEHARPSPERVTRRVTTSALAIGVSFALWLLTAAPPSLAGTRSDLARRAGTALEFVGSWPYGPTYAVDVDAERDLIFIGSGGAVLVLDGTDRTNPTLITDDVRTVGLVEDLFYDADDRDLYVAAGDGGLEIWNLDTPSAPARLSRTEVLYADVETPVREVDVYGECAVVECSWGYVHSLDVSDPANPVHVSLNGTMGNPSHDIYVSPDGQAHTTGAQRYQRLDISTGGVLLGSGAHDFTYGAGAVYGTDEVAYVSYEGNLWILDLFAPGFPAWSVTDVDGIADLVVHDGIAYIINDGGLHVWNVTDHRNPFHVGSTGGSYLARKLVVAEGYAYVAESHLGVRIIEIGDGTAPVEVGRYRTLSVTYDTVVQGDHAYLAHGSDGLIVVDLSDPTLPETAAQLPFLGPSYDVTLDGDHAYVANVGSGVSVVDISDPTNPVEVGRHDAYSTYRIDVANGMAYVVESTPSPEILHVVDVSDPTAPIERGSLHMYDFIWEVFVVGDLVYVANDDLGLRIVDASDPATPRVIGTYAAGSVHDVQVVGSLAHVTSAEFGGGYLVLDVTDRTSPSLVTLYNPSGWLHPFHVAVAGDVTYLGEPQGLPGIHVLDVSDVENPVELEEIVPPGDLFNLTAAGNRLYVSDGAAGVQIFVNESVVAVGEGPGSGALHPGIARVWNAPSPFAPSTAFRIVPHDRMENARLVVYDALGREVRRFPIGALPASGAEIVWDGRDDAGRVLPAGVYYYRLVHAGGRSAARRTMIIR